MSKATKSFIPSVKKMTIDFIRDAVAESSAKNVIGELSNPEVKNLASMLPEVKGRSYKDLRSNLTDWATV